VPQWHRRGGGGANKVSGGCTRTDASISSNSNSTHIASKPNGDGGAMSLGVVLKRAGGNYQAASGREVAL